MSLTTAIILAALGIFSHARTADATGAFDASRVQVLVLGTPHLQQMDRAQRPDTDAVLRRLETYAPDQIAVEWLHPSIDPATTENYRPLANRDSLAAQWGFDLTTASKSLTEKRDGMRAQLNDTGSLVTLGKLYYLTGDQLNAGYQWWLAEGLGENVDGLKTLTHDNFSGHELEVWGFPIARQQNLLYITPFDYQGEDARWIWFDIVMRVLAYAVQEKHGLQQGDDGFEEAFTQCAGKLESFTKEGDPAFMQDYGDIEEVREFVDVVTIWEERRNAPRPPGDENGLSYMKHVQSEAYAAQKREMYDEVFPRITLDGLGRQLSDNWELRNRRMIDFVEQDARRLGSRRILIIVGEGHKPFLDDELRKRGYQVASSLEYIP